MIYFLIKFNIMNVFFVLSQKVIQIIFLYMCLMGVLQQTQGYMIRAS